MPRSQRGAKRQLDMDYEDTSRKQTPDENSLPAQSQEEGSPMGTSSTFLTPTNTSPENSLPAIFPQVVDEPAGTKKDGTSDFTISDDRQATVLDEVIVQDDPGSGGPSPVDSIYSNSVFGSLEISFNEIIGSYQECLQIAARLLNVLPHTPQQENQIEQGNEAQQGSETQQEPRGGDSASALTTEDPQACTLTQEQLTIQSQLYMEILKVKSDLEEEVQAKLGVMTTLQQRQRELKAMLLKIEQTLCAAMEHNRAQCTLVKEKDRFYPTIQCTRNDGCRMQLVAAISRQKQPIRMGDIHSAVKEYFSTDPELQKEFLQVLEDSRQYVTKRVMRQYPLE
jgi:hypothetical protein